MAIENIHMVTHKRIEEFYTELEDIEKELFSYDNVFKDKIIYCNCDEPNNSNFFRFFATFFNLLEIKRLIVVNYSPYIDIIKSPRNFSHEMLSHKLIVNELDGYNGKNVGDLSPLDYLLLNRANRMYALKGNGDFRSLECIEILKECDIVVTYPPALLLKEFIEQLFKYDKKFIILGSQSAMRHKSIFELMVNNKLWLGVDNYGTKRFKVSEQYLVNSKRRLYKDDRGNTYFSMKNLVWFTNIDNFKRHKLLSLNRSYSPIEYQKYDNYDAINVDKLADIPYDYDGVIGVPLTFMDVYNPEQFSILGMAASIKYDSRMVGIPLISGNDARAIVNGKVKSERIFIKIIR